MTAIKKLRVYELKHGEVTTNDEVQSLINLATKAMELAIEEGVDNASEKI